MIEEGICGSEEVRGAVVFGGRTIGRMEGFRQSGRHAGVPPKPPGEYCHVEGDVERKREQPSQQ